MAEFATESTAEGPIGEGYSNEISSWDPVAALPDSVDTSSQAGSSIVTTEPKVSAPLLGTLVYGRILKRVTLIAVKKADRPHDLTETLLKQSKRSSSMTPHDIVAVINTKTGKVLKVKVPVMRHKLVNLYDTLWMVTYREWEHFQKWLKSVGKINTRYGKEVHSHTHPSQLSETELRFFITKYDYELSVEDKRREESQFLNSAAAEESVISEIESVPETPSKQGAGSGYDDEEGGEGEGDLVVEMASITPQATGNMLSPPLHSTFKQKTTKKVDKAMTPPPTPPRTAAGGGGGGTMSEKEKEKGTGGVLTGSGKGRNRETHSSKHDDIDPATLHSSRIRQAYSGRAFHPSSERTAETVKKVAFKWLDKTKANSNGAKKQQGPRGNNTPSGGNNNPQLKKQQPKLNPHFFGHPLDLKTPHHMRSPSDNVDSSNSNSNGNTGTSAAAAAAAAAAAGYTNGSQYSNNSSVTSSQLDSSSVLDMDQSTAEGIRIDLFPGGGSVAKPAITYQSKKPPSKRYTIATASPDVFTSHFAPDSQLRGALTPVEGETVEENEEEETGEGGDDEEEEEGVLITPRVGVLGGIITPQEEETREGDGISDVGMSPRSTEDGLPLDEGDYNDDNESVGSGSSAGSASDKELPRALESRLAVAERKADFESQAKANVQDALEVALREKDVHKEKLEDSDRVRAALECRLQETRTMLQILAARDVDVGSVSDMEKLLNSINAGDISTSRGSPYPSGANSVASSTNSSRLDTPAELRDVDGTVPIRKHSRPSQEGLKVLSQLSSPSASAPVPAPAPAPAPAAATRRDNLYSNIEETEHEPPPGAMLTQEHLVQASEEQRGEDNVLLDLVESGDEELRLANSHARDHGYVPAQELNRQEHEADDEEQRLLEAFISTQEEEAGAAAAAAADAAGGVMVEISGATNNGDNDDNINIDSNSNSKQGAGGSKSGVDLWASDDTIDLLRGAPKDLAKRLHVIDSRFLTVKEKLFRPFLRVHKGVGRKIFTDPRAVTGAMQSQWEICIWTIFQIYGRAGAGDSAIVRFITQLQVNRALKEAGIPHDIQGRLELSLTKLRAGTTKSSGGGSGNGSSQRGTGSSKSGSGKGSRNSNSNSNSNSDRKAEFGFSFSEFLEAMHMLVTMLRNSRYKVGGRGEKLGVARGVTSDVLSTKVFSRDRAAGVVQSMRDDAWEATRAHVEELLIKACAGEKGNAVINTRLEDSMGSFLCLSGVIPKTSVYLASFPSTEELQSPHATVSDIATSLAEIVKAPLPVGYEACRAIWDRNAEQAKQLYYWYASQLEPRPLIPDSIVQGSSAVATGTDTAAVPAAVAAGASSNIAHATNANEDLASIFNAQYQDSVATASGGALRSGAVLMLSFDNLRSLLTDFEIFPQHIDFQSLARIYRSVKLWEWAWCDILSVRATKCTDDAAAGGGAGGGSQSPPTGGTGGYNYPPGGAAAIAGQMCYLHTLDPMSMASGSGNMSITLGGFIEVITRISHLGCDFSAKDAVRDVKSDLTYLLRLMNESQGRKLLLGKRRSVNVRPFSVSSSLS